MTKNLLKRQTEQTESNDHDVIVIGGGVVGVCTAYYMQKAGINVTLLEQNRICSGSSWGNAGWLVPSHSVPLARPGAVTQGLKWMLNPESPFYIKPRLSLDLINWLLRFRRAANLSSLREVLGPLVELGEVSLQLYAELEKEETSLNSHYDQKGLIALYATTDWLKEGIEEAHLLSEFGVHSQTLDTEQVLDMDPAVKPTIAGGVYYPDEAHVKPDDLVKGLASIINERGVKLHENTAVTGFNTSEGKIKSVLTTNGVFTADEVVLATGAWSPRVVQELKLDLPIQPAKGYSISFEDIANPPSFPLMLAESKVGVTPMGPVLRFAGTLELSGLNTDINDRRLGAIRRAGDKFLTTDITNASEVVWCGMRPLTPDSVPIIGRASQLGNLILATGHSMTGVTLGAVTGKLVTQIATGQHTAVDMSPFSPMRF